MWYNSLMRRILRVVLLLGVCSRAFALTADRLPPSSFADTEVSTNVAPKGAFVVVSGDNIRYLLLDLELNATPSNNVEVAFGRDADEDGDLSFRERAFVVGWDCGAWFYRDRRTGESVRHPRPSGRRTLHWKVVLNAEGRPVGLEAEDQIPVLGSSPTATMFENGWNLVRITARGHGIHEEDVSVRMGRRPFKVSIR